MTLRLLFCLDHVNIESRIFDDMMDVIHVREKRFYTTQNVGVIILDWTRMINTVQPKASIFQQTSCSSLLSHSHIGAKQIITDSTGNWEFGGLQNLKLRKETEAIGLLVQR